MIVDTPAGFHRSIHFVLFSALILALAAGSTAVEKVRIVKVKTEMELQYEVLLRDIQRRGHILGHAE